MFVVIFFSKSIKRIVAKKNVTVAFFINFHIVIIRDIKNVRKIMNKRKISFRLKMVRIVSIEFMFSYL